MVSARKKIVKRVNLYFLQYHVNQESLIFDQKSVEINLPLNSDSERATYVYRSVSRKSGNVIRENARA